jgi:DNA-binding HxlR family transcriptional regulator
MTQKDPNQSETVQRHEIKADGGEKDQMNELYDLGRSGSGPMGPGRMFSHFIMEDTRYQLLMNMLGHPQQKPSFKELNFMTSCSKSTVSEHLSKLVRYGIVDKLEVPKGRRKRGRPRTFYQVSGPGYILLNSASPLPVDDRWLQNRYKQVEKPKKIEQYEELSRVDAEKVTQDVDEDKLKQLHGLVSDHLEQPVNQHLSDKERQNSSIKSSMEKAGRVLYGKMKNLGSHQDSDHEGRGQSSDQSGMINT